MVMNSVGLYNLAQNTVSQVSLTTGLKAVGRPGFIVIDKDLDSRTKKFAAIKEFLYQMTCLGIFLALVPVFDKATFKLAKKMYKDLPIFKVFDNPEQFKKINKLPQKEKLTKIEEIIENKNLNTKELNITTKDVLDENSTNLVQGVVEAGSIASSVIGLAILAPIVSHPFIATVLDKFNKDK